MTPKDGKTPRESEGHRRGGPDLLPSGFPGRWSRRSRRSGMRSRHRSSGRPFPSSFRDGTSWARRPPGPAKRPPSRSPCSSGSRRSPAPRGGHGGARPRPDEGARDAGRRGRAQVRPHAGRPRRSALRRRADGSAGPRPEARRGRRGRDAGPRPRPHPPRESEARLAAFPRSRRRGRDARHGLRRRPRRDPRGDARDASDRALLGHDPAAHRLDRAAPHEQAGPRDDRAREAGFRETAAAAPGRLRRPARAEGGGSRARPRDGKPGVRASCSAGRGSRWTS